MGKAETLQRLKDAEAQIRTMKEEAERERERTLRTARREALDLLDTYRSQAEARYREIVTGAGAAITTERDRMLAIAKEEAARMADRGKANVAKAVDSVLAKFREAIRA